MTPKQMKTRTATKDKARIFANKALQFFNTMHYCVIDEEWDAATLNGVHAAISITDALLVQRTGLHSISPKHDDAVTLLRQHYSIQELQRNDSRLAKILTFKSLVSYQPEQMTSPKAQQFIKDVERYMHWARVQLR